MLINDLRARGENNRTAIDLAVARVFDRAWLVIGPEVSAFESAFSEYIGAEYCISIANGADSIELALKSLGVVQGDSVATVANAGMYTSTALLAIGATPVFMDVDLDLKNVTFAEVNRAINEGVKAVVVTHLYGLAVADIQEIAALCKSCDVALLEDCTQAHGAMIANQRVGTFGDAASFSFYPTKNLGALGDGGAVVTNNLSVAERVSFLLQYGCSSKYKFEMAGACNSRLDEQQAAILSVFLPDIDSINTRRRAIATSYSQMIHHPKVHVAAVHGNEFVGHLYIIRTEDRDSLRAHLKAHNISSEVHYPIPDYRQPIFGGHYKDLFLPNTERLSAEILTLPCYPEMSETDVEEVIVKVNSWQ